jgi:hypothetical protein
MVHLSKADIDTRAAFVAAFVELRVIPRRALQFADDP